MRARRRIQAVLDIERYTGPRRPFVPRLLLLAILVKKQAYHAQEKKHTDTSKRADHSPGHLSRQRVIHESIGQDKRSGSDKKDTEYYWHVFVCDIGHRGDKQSFWALWTGLALWGFLLGLLPGLLTLNTLSLAILLMLLLLLLIHLFSSSGEGWYVCFPVTRENNAALVALRAAEFVSAGRVVAI